MAPPYVGNYDMSHHVFVIVDMTKRPYKRLAVANGGDGEQEKAR